MKKVTAFLLFHWTFNLLAQNNMIYSGGFSSGNHSDCFSQTSTFLNNSIFNGSYGSGFSMFCHNQDNAMTNNSIFFGGSASGFYFDCSGSIHEIPLPIELLLFYVEQKESVVHIYWSTASEQNNDFFTIERSRDGVSWEILNHTPAAGNSTVLINYESVDEKPYSGISYYRLKQTDFDGVFVYSNSVSVNFQVLERYVFEFFPNPANEIVFIRVNQSVYEIEISDSCGRLIYKQDNSNAIALESFYAGVYFIHATFSDYTRISRKLIIAR